MLIFRIGILQEYLDHDACGSVGIPIYVCWKVFCVWNFCACVTSHWENQLYVVENCPFRKVCFIPAGNKREICSLSAKCVPGKEPTLLWICVQFTLGCIPFLRNSYHVDLPWDVRVYLQSVCEIRLWNYHEEWSGNRWPFRRRVPGWGVSKFSLHRWIALSADLYKMFPEEMGWFTLTHVGL